MYLLILLTHLLTCGQLIIHRVQFVNGEHSWMIEKGLGWENSPF